MCYTLLNISLRVPARKGSGLSHKLIVKTAVKTALIILGVLAVAFAIFNVACPQHVATFLESVGSYGMAVKYADLRYTYTGDGYDLARCFDDSMLSGDDEDIVTYGEELVAHGDFDGVCERKDGQFGGYFSYRHRVYSALASSYYSLGENDKAIAYAVEDNGTDSFARSNSLMALADRVIKVRDLSTAEKLIAELKKISPTEEDDIKNLNDVLESLNGLWES